MIIINNDILYKIIEYCEKLHEQLRRNLAVIYMDILYYYSASSYFSKPYRISLAERQFSRGTMEHGLRRTVRVAGDIRREKPFRFIVKTPYLHVHATFV